MQQTAPDALPILYSFRRCPYAMRARLGIAASGQTCALREVVLADKPAELLEASGKGTVPVLVLSSAQVIDQSLEIMLWALQHRDPHHWLPQGDAAMQSALQLVAQCDGAFKFHLDRYKYPTRYGLPNGLEHRNTGAEFLEQLNTRLTMGPSTLPNPAGHLCSPHFGLADAAIAPFVRQFAHTAPAWFAQQTWPALQQWLDAFEESTEFHRVMQKYAPWAAGQPAVLFPEPEVAIN
jgi:glutathione S-transferase